jgi:DNA-binding MurR/RpiR family transcriptional regulator
MIADSAKLTRKQELFIVALLAEATIADAAKKVGISEPTALRWMKISAFQEEYRQARRAVFDQAISAMQRLATTAVEALSRNLHADAPPAVQVGAARTILEHAKTANLEEILERLARLETIIMEREEAAQHPARRWA